jgi:hypothetical protein
MNGIHEVTGSTPVWSTISKSLIPKWPESPTHSVSPTARRAHFAPHVFCRDNSASNSEVEVSEMSGFRVRTARESERRSIVSSARAAAP